METEEHVKVVELIISNIKNICMQTSKTRKDKLNRPTLGTEGHSFEQIDNFIKLVYESTRTSHSLQKPNTIYSVLRLRDVDRVKEG